MRPTSLATEIKKSLKMFLLALMTISSLASFKDMDSSKPFTIVKATATAKLARSSKGYVNMSKSVTVNRSLNEVHNLFVNSADKNDLLVKMPEMSDILESNKEVEQNFIISSMWEESSRSEKVQQSLDEVNIQFEKDAQPVITVKPCHVNSMDEVEQQFQTENRF
jgi:hypothetical protein